MKAFKYDWYWEKERLTNVFQAHKRPGKTIETISVFYGAQCLYFPQKMKRLGSKVANKIGADARWAVTMAGHSAKSKPLAYKDDGTRLPSQLLRLNRDNALNRIHPTQKPVPLFEYLIRTYTNEGDTVLDNVIGSGTTAVAAFRTGRRWIGMEKDAEIFEKACERIEQDTKQQNLFTQSAGRYNKRLQPDQNPPREHAVANY